MAENVDINYVQSFGERGTGNLQFDFPQGICEYANSFYVCDRQNNRVQLIGSTGNFILEFGSDKMDCPHSVLVDGSSVFVSDTNNHRILKYTTSGNFVSEFGSFGTGNDNFKYPTSLAIDGNNLYILDYQNNRVVIHNKSTGAYVNEFVGFDLPSAMCIFNESLYVVTDSNIIVQYELTGDFVRLNRYLIHGYANSIKEVEGVLCITDSNENKLYFCDSELNLIDTFNGFDYPFDITSIGTNLLAITQPHEVLIYTLKVDLGLEYITEFESLNKELYPTGRAWWKLVGTYFSKLHEALSISESRILSELRTIQTDFYADNQNMSDDGVSHWLSVFGINSNGTKSEKISLIKQAQGYPNGIYARQSVSFIENQLRLAGFNVYLHYVPNYDIVGAIHNLFKFGEKVHGAGSTSYTIVANNTYESRDSSFTIDTDVLTFAFYVCSDVIGETANIELERKNEFRELILKLKPAHSVGILFINYI